MNGKVTSLGDEFYGRCENVVSDIADAILRSGNSSYGLNNGDAGKMLFLNNFLKFSSDEQCVERLVNLSNNALATIVSCSKVDASMSMGLSGFLFVVKDLVEDGVLSAKKFRNCEVEDALFRTMEFFCKNGKFDFLSGALGISLFFLNERQYDRVDVCFESLVEQINKQTKECPYLVSEYWNNEPVINLGLAHGLSSILSILSIARIDCDVFEKYRPIALRISKFLLLYQKEDESGLFPSVVIGDKAVNYGKLSWCYGDISVGYSLFLYSEAFNDDFCREISLQILSSTSKRLDKDKVNIVDACLCHGTSGLAYIYRELYKRTQRAEFWEASIYWYAQTHEMSRQCSGNGGFVFNLSKREQAILSPFGFLNGISGVGLSMMNLISNEYSNWGRLLLLG